MDCPDCSTELFSYALMPIRYLKVSSGCTAKTAAKDPIVYFEVKADNMDKLDYPWGFYSLIFPTAFLTCV